jgi:hypothetical protein
LEQISRGQRASLEHAYSMKMKKKIDTKQPRLPRKLTLMCYFEVLYILLLFLKPCKKNLSWHLSFR